MANNTPTPPHDIASEAAIIGTIVCHPEFIMHSEHLKGSHFYNRENGYIYWAIDELFKKGISNIDDFNIITQVESNKAIKKLFDKLNINNIQEFLNLTKNVARHTIEEYKNLVNIVLNYAFKREMLLKLKQFESLCMDENNDESAASINYKVHDELTNLTGKYLSEENIKTVGEIVDDVWKEIEESRQINGYTGFTSKFELVNEFFTYEPGELILISGREKSGKSMFFMNEVLDKVKKGIPTAIFDTEMSDRRWLERLLALMSGVSVKNLRYGKYNENEFERIKEAKDFLKENNNLVHIYNTNWQPENIYTTAKILKLKMNLQFLVYDYIKMTDFTNSKIKESDYLGEITNLLKNKIGGGLDISILAGAQMSPYDLKVSDSAKLQRYASTICFWMAKVDEELARDGSNGGNFKLHIKYNRLGKQMMNDEEGIFFNFNGDFARIEQASQQYKKGDSPNPFD